MVGGVVARDTKKPKKNQKKTKKKPKKPKKPKNTSPLSIVIPKRKVEF